MNDGFQVRSLREHATRFAWFVGLSTACGCVVGNGSDAGQILIPMDSSTTDQSTDQAPRPDTANDDDAASDGDGTSSDSGNCGSCSTVETSDAAALCEGPDPCFTTLAEAMATLCRSNYGRSASKWTQPCQGIMVVQINTTVDESELLYFDATSGGLKAVAFGGAGYNSPVCTAVPGFTLPCQCSVEDSVNDIAGQWVDLCPDARAGARTITDASREATD